MIPTNRFFIEGSKAESKVMVGRPGEGVVEPIE